jgi:hypothetical protein
MADARRFTATCPRCAERATFLAVRIEKAVLTQAEVAEGARPGFEGFRCLSCRKVVAEADDEEGWEHRWADGEPVTYPIETGVPPQR